MTIPAQWDPAESDTRTNRDDLDQRVRRRSSKKGRQGVTGDAWMARWIGGFQSSVLRGRQHPRQFSCHPRCGGLAAIVGRASMSKCLARARVR